VRLLAVGEGSGATGYGRVMEGVLGRLPFEVKLFAVDQRGPDSGMVLGNQVPGDNYGVDQLPELLERVDPDVVLFHHNAGFFGMHRAAVARFRARRPGTRVVVYTPADRSPDSLADADVVVFYTQAGLEAAGAGLRDVAVIPHGVDERRFFPVPDARRRLDLPEDAFIVLNANRNVRRKRVEVTMRGFAAFARGRSGAWLYLHMGMRDLGVDVLSLASELGISDRLLVTTSDARHPRVTDERLNLIYNACDVGVNTAAAEAWGLVSFEHAATGAAQIVPDVPARRELWDDAAAVMPAPPEPSSLADALARLHDDRTLLAERSRAACEHARSERFSWSAIAGQWEALLRRAAAHS
jgi:D-inositol-3-phosphate glycosyltransferase